jgi:large subunit ribosomal protein L6
MSRIGKSPINIPSGVEVSLADKVIEVSGPKGKLKREIHNLSIVSIDDNIISVNVVNNSKKSIAMSGTTRALINNMVVGVSNGFEKKLLLNGVGYRAQSKGKILNLTLGFSHPVNYAVPEGINIETPSQTEIVVSGIDKQLVGQVSADVRAYRPPEPYKGKGIKYADEIIIKKEAEKK